tara:strand:+ start:11803 stop:12312 length:510 start_codon:yes stop_codon:yes gene_type:complete
MWNLNAYLSDLVVEQDDEEFLAAKDLVEASAILCNDKWLTRQAHFGMAGAMERQLEFLGGTLLPNAEDKLRRMESNGIIGESYTKDSWFGATNEEDPHINDEIPFDQVKDDQQTFIEEIRTRMRTAAIIFVVHVRAHDLLSSILQPQQLSYSAIKTKSKQKMESMRRAS